VALGQTSWGPTGFCAIKGIGKAASLTSTATEKFADIQTLSIISASARNSGGDVLLE
jgi:predicted sugar kinase